MSLIELHKALEGRGLFEELHCVYPTTDPMLSNGEDVGRFVELRVTNSDRKTVCRTVCRDGSTTTVDKAAGRLLSKLKVT